MTYPWIILIAFVFYLGALPKTIRQYRQTKEKANLLEIVGTVFLGIALICYLAERVFTK